MPVELMPWISLRCTEALFYQLQVIDRNGRNPIRAYLGHKSNAKHRGIAFDLTLAEWWNIWKTSGHYHERGRGARRYVMARKNDLGPYAVGNVSIQTGAENQRTKVRMHRENELLRGWVRQHPQHHSRSRIAEAI